MAMLRNFLANTSGVFAILIVIASYYYITIISLGGLPTFELDPFAAQVKSQVKKKSAPQNEFKGPINIKPEDFLLVNTKKCELVRHRRANLIVLFLITIMSKNYQARETLRMSWALPDIYNKTRFESVYIMGKPKTATWDDKRIWHNEYGELSREAESHRDMVLIDYIEDYNNISFKVAAGLYWAKHHCWDVDYIIQVHDDVMIRRDQLIPYLHELPREGFIGGDCANDRKPDRNPESSFYVSEKDHPEKVYPPYCYGSAVIMTPDIRDKLLEQTYKTPYFKRDDVYLGHLMRDAGIEPVKVPNVSHHVADRHYCDVKGLIMLQPVPLTKQQSLKEEHERFEDENRKCPPKKNTFRAKQDLR